MLKKKPLRYSDCQREQNEYNINLHQKKNKIEENFVNWY